MKFEQKNKVASRAWNRAGRPRACFPFEHRNHDSSGSGFHGAGRIHQISASQEALDCPAKTRWRINTGRVQTAGRSNTKLAPERSQKTKQSHKAPE
jgi:hypothetical protein